LVPKYGTLCISRWICGVRWWVN